MLKERMKGEKLKKKKTGRLAGRRLRERSQLRWLDDVEEDNRKTGTRKCGRKGENREEWAIFVRKAKALQGL